MIATIHSTDSDIDFAMPSGTQLPHLLPQIQVPVAYVLLYDHKNPQYVVFRRSHKDQFGLPGGKCYCDESSEVAAKREVLEEVGIRLKRQNLELLLHSEFPNFRSTWSKQTVLEHGYQLDPKVPIVNGSRVQVYHPVQYFYTAAVDVKEIPAEYEGRELRLINLARNGNLLLIARKFVPAIEEWRESLRI